MGRLFRETFATGMFATMCAGAVVFHTAVPAHTFDVILGRPTQSAITASILAWVDLDGYLEYGPDVPTGAGEWTSRTTPARFPRGTPVEVRIASLRPDTRYHYRLRYRSAGDEQPFWTGEEATFQTQRKPGSAFRFTVQADSHLDQTANPDLYARTLENVAAARPDFHIDLGDAFMTAQRGADFKSALPQYLAQRYYFGVPCRSAPLFLVLGNHDGEAGFRTEGGADSMAVWAAAQRRKYFPNPRPDGFYSGNGTPERHAGLLEDYYAWEWGDALFVVLDPFWPTTDWPTTKPGGDWRWTLGAQQYAWLRKTLEVSRAPLRFVFIHHPTGRLRGGIEAAQYSEWGGLNADGTPGFARHRPGWEMPVHQLLVRHHVNVVFHGHDHLFAKEDLDGIVYQEVPQPDQMRGSTRHATEYGYTHGDVLGGSGHLTIRVTGRDARVEYVVSVLPGEDRAGRKNGTVAYSYAVTGRPVQQESRSASRTVANARPIPASRITGP